MQIIESNPTLFEHIKRLKEILPVFSIDNLFFANQNNKNVILFHDAKLQHVRAGSIF